MTPNTLERGRYCLKKELWADFDPYFRQYTPRARQAALDRGLTLKLWQPHHQLKAFPPALPPCLAGMHQVPGSPFSLMCGCCGLLAVGKIFSSILIIPACIFMPHIGQLATHQHVVKHQPPMYASCAGCIWCSIVPGCSQSVLPVYAQQPSDEYDWPFHRLIRCCLAYCVAHPSTSADDLAVAAINLLALVVNTGTAAAATVADARPQRKQGSDRHPAASARLEEVRVVLASDKDQQGSFLQQIEVMADSPARCGSHCFVLNGVQCIQPAPAEWVQIGGKGWLIRRPLEQYSSDKRYLSTLQWACLSVSTVQLREWRKVEKKNTHTFLSSFLVSNHVFVVLYMFLFPPLFF